MLALVELSIRPENRLRWKHELSTVKYFGTVEDFLQYACAIEKHHGETLETLIDELDRPVQCDSMLGGNGHWTNSIITIDELLGNSHFLISLLLQ